jgi:hypothetical protein
VSRFGVGFPGGYGVPGNDSYTKILLHFDGVNGDTAFVDSNVGGNAHSWHVLGATLTTAASKFGNASLFTSGSPGGIYTPNSSDLNLGSSNFTVDCWWNPAGVSAGGFQGICGQQRPSASLSQVGLYVYRDNSNKIVASAYSGTGTNILLTSATSVAANRWYHIAMVRSGSTAYLFIDGVQDAIQTGVTGAINYDSGGAFGVGCTGLSVPYSSGKYLDEFRLSVGIARWTSNFTPPDAPYI